MIEKYKANAAFHRIKKEKFDHETGCYLYYGGARFVKNTVGVSYFGSFYEAKEFIVNYYKLKIDRLRADLLHLKDELEEAEDLRE